MAKKRNLNDYFEKMLAAKRKGAASFTYKGKTYKRVTLDSGMITYKNMTRRSNPMYSDDDFDEDGYFIYPMEHIDKLVRSRSMPSREVSQFLKRRAKDWDVVYDDGDIVGLTFKLYDEQIRIPYKIPVGSKYFKNALDIMKSQERKRRKNPMATGTLLAFGIGYFLGKSK